jgi:hypothetical protein
MILYPFCVLQGVPQEKQKAIMSNELGGFDFIVSTVQYAVMWG